MKVTRTHLATMSVAAASLISVSLLWQHNLILFIVLAVLAALMLLVRKSKQELYAFIFCAIAGVMAEAIAMAFDAWSYTNPDVFSVPMWLFLLWGLAAIFTIRVYLFFGPQKKA